MNVVVDQKQLHHLSKVESFCNRGNAYGEDLYNQAYEDIETFITTSERSFVKSYADETFSEMVRLEI